MGFPAFLRSRLRVMSAALFVIAMLLVSALPSGAQVPGINAQTMTPIEGVGHDYLKILDDTVDPSSGSLSLKINIPLPAGRQLNLPFALTYNSNGATYVVDSDVPNIAPDWFGGWGHSLPTMSATEQDLNSEILPTGAPPINGPCNVHYGYVFKDATGARYGFPILTDVEYEEGSNGCSAPDSNYPFTPAD